MNKRLPIWLIILLILLILPVLYLLSLKQSVVNSISKNDYDLPVYRGVKVKAFIKLVSDEMKASAKSIEKSKDFSKMVIDTLSPEIPSHQPILFRFTCDENQIEILVIKDEPMDSHEFNVILNKYEVDSLYKSNSIRGVVLNKVNALKIDINYILTKKSKGIKRFLAHVLPDDIKHDGSHSFRESNLKLGKMIQTVRNLAYMANGKSAERIGHSINCDGFTGFLSLMLTNVVLDGSDSIDEDRKVVNNKIKLLDKFLPSVNTKMVTVGFKSGNKIEVIVVNDFPMSNSELLALNVHYEIDGQFQTMKPYEHLRGEDGRNPCIANEIFINVSSDIPKKKKSVPRYVQVLRSEQIKRVHGMTLKTFKSWLKDDLHEIGISVNDDQLRNLNKVQEHLAARPSDPIIASIVIGSDNKFEILFFRTRAKNVNEQRRLYHVDDEYDRFHSMKQYFAVSNTNQSISIEVGIPLKPWPIHQYYREFEGATYAPSKDHDDEWFKKNKRLKCYLIVK